MVNAVTRQRGKTMTDRHAVPFVALAALVIVLGVPTTASAQSALADFAVCAACHTVGGGKLVGPDLAGVAERRSEEWLIAFIKSPKSMIDSGDETAKGLLAEHNNVLMPDNPQLDDARIRALLAHIAEGGGGGGGGEVEAIPDRPATPEDVANGRAMFEGRIRFENRGPACFSCHNADEYGLGGVLAADLSDVVSRMGGVKVVQVFIQGQGAAVMRAAYVEDPLTPMEIFSVAAYLEDANREAVAAPKPFGLKLFVAGFGAFVVLMGLYWALWGRTRKARSVNQDIYDRQVQSS